MLMIIFKELTKKMSPKKNKDGEKKKKVANEKNKDDKFHM